MFDIRPGSDSDKNQILDLIRDVFGTEQAERAERRWRWQWHEDPRLEKPGYRGVVAEWNGRVIGNLSSIPAGLHIAGQSVEAYWFADALVHWGHLRQALKERKRSGETGGPDLSGGIAAAMLNHPAAGSMQLGKHIAGTMETIGYRIGFKAVRETGSWARLISFRQPVESVTGRHLGALIGGVADLSIPKIPKPKLEVKPMEGDFDERFDELWARAKLEHQAITRRDMSTLNWRYRRHPDTSYSVLAVEEAGVLRGYLAYSIFFRHQQRRAQIVDILARQGDSAALDSLIAAALQQMRAERVHKVECYAGGAEVGSALRGAGFAARLNKGKGQPVLARGLPDVELYVMRGDGDCG